MLFLRLLIWSYVYFLLSLLMCWVTLIDFECWASLAFLGWTLLDLGGIILLYTLMDLTCYYFVRDFFLCSWKTLAWSFLVNIWEKVCVCAFISLQLCVQKPQSKNLRVSPLPILIPLTVRNLTFFIHNIFI